MQKLKSSHEGLKKRTPKVEKHALKHAKEDKKSVSINSSNLSFADLVDIAELQLLVSQLSVLANCPMAILGGDNSILASANWQKICTCFHRVHPQTKKHCDESDCTIRQNLNTDKPMVYKCKNGLWDVAYPILIEEKHLATIFFGQFLLEDEAVDVPYFEQQAKKYGFDKAEYLASLKEVPILSRKKVEALADYFTSLAHVLAKTGYANLLLKKEKIEELRIVNEQLKESELKYRRLFEQAGVGVSHVETLTGKFLKVNTKFAQMLGYTIEEMMQLTFLSFTHPDDIIESTKNRKLLVDKQNKEYEIEKRYVRKDGSIVWVKMTTTQIWEMDGNNKYHISIVRDITERKRAEQVLKEENKRFQTTMNAIDSVVYVADMDTHEILFINKYVKEVFGDITGKKCYAALQDKTSPCDFCTNHLLLDDKGNANQPYIWEFQNSITKRWYQCHDQAIQWTNGKLARFEIATDITKNIEYEQTLKENEIKLKELNSTKDKFFSIISHDLKNPFAVIKSSSELLSIYLEKNDLAKSKAKAAMIVSASNNGYALLENLLVWAKSQTGGIKFEPRELNLKNKVADCITQVADRAIEKNIIITNKIPDDLVLEVDENLLSVVFRNLITNAIKFTHNGGAITIIAKTGNNIVEVAVIDTGIGIPKEHQYKLFRLDTNFSRVGTANEESTSLGLILCKEFVEKHKGKIWVESDAGKGSEFRFTLPCIQKENE
ncbi:MAG TPA: PocR ligand-binding domain-containing protein [Bacteroidia bacterium]